MLAAVPPAFLLALLLILISTQLAYVVAPGRPHYLVRLGLSAVAVLAGEMAGLVGLGRSLALGNLHPANDLAALALLQWLGGWVGRRETAV